MLYPGLEGRVAVVTGANHGIGAATAVLLARNGVRVLVTYLRLDDPVVPGTPETYRSNRAKDARSVVEAIRLAGGVRAGRDPGQQRNQLAGGHLPASRG